MRRRKWLLAVLAGSAALVAAAGLALWVARGARPGPAAPLTPPAPDTRPPTGDGRSQTDVAGAAAPEPPRDLLAAPSDEQSIGAGGKHVYAVDLGAGQVARVAVDQRGADVALAVLDPDGAEQIVVDRPIGTGGTERVSLLAAQAGVHRLEVRNPGGEGRYALHVVDGPRPATAADRARAEAEALFMAGRRLEKGSLPDYVAAAETYRRGSELAAQAQDRQLQAISLARLGDCLYGLDEVDRAFEVYQQALPMLDDAGETSSAAEIHNTLGVIARGRGRFEEAVAHYAEADRVGALAGNEPARVTALGNRAVIDMYRGEIGRALDAFRG